jgi:hypothetical protein
MLKRCMPVTQPLCLTSTVKQHLLPPELRNHAQHCYSTLYTILHKHMNVLLRPAAHLVASLVLAAPTVAPSRASGWWPVINH